MTLAHSKRYRAGALAEALVFAAGLVMVATIDPARDAAWTICPLHHLGEWIGASFCPGCGLGRSVAWLVRSNVEASVAAHPFGIPAVAILATHIARLVAAAVHRA